MVPITPVTTRLAMLVSLPASRLRRLCGLGDDEPPVEGAGMERIQYGDVEGTSPCLDVDKS